VSGMLSLVWIIAYSVVFVNCLCYLLWWKKTRSKAVLSYFLLLANMIVLTLFIVSFILPTREPSYAKIFVLFNVIACYLFTVPNFISASQGRDSRAIDRAILGIFAFSVLLVNILVARGSLFAVYAIFAVSPILYLAVFGLLFRNVVVAGDKDDSRLRAGLSRIGLLNWLIVIVFCAFAFAANSLFAGSSNAVSLVFALMTIAYQIPGLILFNSLRRREVRVDIDASLSLLTKREREIAQRLCAGRTYAEIADELFISLSAVKKHCYSIYRKLGVRNNRELMLLAMPKIP